MYAFIPDGAAIRDRGPARACAARIVKPGAVVTGIDGDLERDPRPSADRGVGTGKPLGRGGAGLATTNFVSIGVAVLVAYFIRLEHLRDARARAVAAALRPLGRLLNIGLPAGGEFRPHGVFVGVIYWIARDWGSPRRRRASGSACARADDLRSGRSRWPLRPRPSPAQNFGAQDGARCAKRSGGAAIRRRR
jgi:hypothetical protein